MNSDYLEVRVYLHKLLAIIVFFIFYAVKLFTFFLHYIITKLCNDDIVTGTHVYIIIRTYLTHNNLYHFCNRPNNFCMLIHKL